MALPYVRTLRNIVLPGQNLGTLVTVLMPDGREILGDLNFNWDAVVGVPEKIVVRHGQFTYEYLGDSFLMFKSVWATADGSKRYDLNVAVCGATTVVGHTFKDDGSAEETVFDLSKFSFTTLAKVLRG